jgi:asparagine N-glycosylation enzyme membrane subunit Stt3/protocatechuate 3,4-dioxygenase beta subunit
MTNRNISSHTNRTRKRPESKDGDAGSIDFDTSMKIFFKTNDIVKWLKRDWFYIAALIGIFFMAFFLRSYFYYDIAVNPPYPDYDFILSGNDPYYHKQIIDYVQDNGGHLYRDPMLNYPLSGRNPYPPVYDWSVAITGMTLGGVTGIGTHDATWFVMLFAPAFWGAMIIFPVYFITRDIFGKKPGLIAAFFMGIMPSHIERSPLGFSDHDAIVLFFVVTTFFFLAKAFNNLNDKNWVESWKSPRSISLGLRDFFAESKIAMGFALLSGFTIGLIALMWKGFPYVMVIIAGYYIVQLIFNKFRKVDSLGLFMVIIVVNFSALLMSFPLAYQLGAGIWYNPFFILVGIIVVGMIFIPTRDYPWIIVMPAVASAFAVGYFAISIAFPIQADSLFSGGGYLVKSKLYSTIAEAQAPDLSRLVFSYGPVTFYMSLVGLVLAIIALPKHWNKDYFLIIVWCSLAIYMAMSAVRFIFNASPVFAILTGWTIWMIVDKVDPTLRKFKRPEAKMIYAYVGFGTLITLFGSLYITYSYLEQYAYFQWLFGLCAFGIGMCLFGLYMTFRFHIYFAYLLMGGFVAIFLLFTWFRMNEIFYVSLILLAIVAVPLFIFVMFKYTASGVRIELKHIGLATFFTFLIVLPNLWFAVDSGIPYESKRDFDPQNQLLGAFGHSFVSEYWLDGMRWLSEQDNELPKEERPGFVSWWDYGFWCIYLGQHPSVAENFQNGYHFAGSFIASQNETEAVTLLTLRVIEGDIVTFSGANVEPILIKYLDEGDEENHPNYSRLYDAMLNPSNYIDEVMDNRDTYGHYVDLKPENTKYAIGRVVITDNMNLEEIVEMYDELIQATGHSIRYFAVDSRLFPFTASNTGIFYAPIRLADRDIDDYLEYLANAEYRLSSTSDEWIAFPDNPLTTDRLEEEIDSRGQDLVRIIQWDLKYRDEFYNTMFYRAFIGWRGSDAGLPDDSVPGIDDSNQATPTDGYQAMQGWNMTHFKLVYRTLYWNPFNQTTLGSDEAKYSKYWRATSYKEGLDIRRELESDGVDNDGNGLVDDEGEGGTVSQGPRSSAYYLKYYHGAIVQGQVRSAPSSDVPGAVGRPVPGVRVTVLDDYTIPHDVTYTDENGWYSVIVPPGDVTIVVSKDGFDEQDINTKILLVEKTQINNTQMFITEDQAMRRVNNYIIHNDIRLEPGTLNGTVFWDNNGNDIFDETDERPAGGVKVILTDVVKGDHENEGIRAQYVLETETDENGFYQINEIIPGKYRLETMIAGHKLTHSDEIEFQIAEGKSVDFGAKPGGLQGTLVYLNDTLAANVTMELYDEINEKTTSMDTFPNGTFRFVDLLPGNYTLKIEKPGFETIEDVIGIEESKFNNTVIKLIPITPINGYAWHDKNSNGQVNANELLPNTRITFFNLIDPQLTTVMYTDSASHYSGNISAGNYTVYARYNDNSTVLANLDLLLIEEDAEIINDFNIMLEPATMVNGTAAKIENRTIAGILVYFEGLSDSTLYPVPTNNSGGFRTYLPQGEYVLRVHDVNFSATFAHVEEFELGTEPMEFNFNMVWATRINGTVFWDRNGDGMFTSYWFDTSPEMLDSGAQPGESPDSGLPQDDTTGQGDDELDSGFNTTEEQEIPSYVMEGIEGITIYFTSNLGTIPTFARQSGHYITHLPPGEYNISIDDPRFKPFTETVPIEDQSVFVPNYITGPPHIFINFSVEPVSVPMSGKVWYDENENGIFDSNETAIPDLTITMTNTSLGGGNYTTTTNTDGEYQITAIPGFYKIEIDERLASGIRYTFSEDEFLVPLKGENIAVTGEVTKDLPLKKFIRVEYAVELDGNLLGSDELRSTNMTLHLYDEDEIEILPIEVDDIDLGGYVQPGDYSLWLDYRFENNQYIFLGTHGIDVSTRELELPLVQTVKVNGTIYNETGNFGIIDNAERIFDVNITLKPLDGNGGMMRFESVAGLYSLYVISDLTYSISIDTVRDEDSSGKSISVRYLYDSSKKIEGDTSFNVEAVRYLNISGLLFYNVFESDLILTEPPAGSDEQVIGGDLGKIIANATITFVELPESTQKVSIITRSNETGNFSVFLRDNVRYNVTIDRSGFEQLPAVITSFEATVDNSTFNLQAEPSYVTLSGTITDSEHGTPVTDVNLELILQFENRETVFTVTDINDGQYSIDLVPEEYTIYGYTPAEREIVNQTITLHRSLTYFDSVELNISEDMELDIEMLPGMRLDGNVKYYDSDNKRVIDVSLSNSDGEGLLFESESTGSQKYADVINGFYQIHLPYGNYSVKSELGTFEFDMNMTYEIDELLTVTNMTGRTNLEFSKNSDYRFDFELMEGFDSVLTVSPASVSTFKYKLISRGNSPNTISFKTAEKPEGWEVGFDPASVSLPINGEEFVEITIKTSSDSFHDNDVVLQASSQIDQNIIMPQTLEINIPALFNYDFYTEASLTHGIAFNDTLVIPLTIQNTGNAEDTITITGPHVPDAWNVTIEGIALEELEPISFAQEEVYKNVTLRVVSPDGESGHMIGEKLSLNLFSRSEFGNKSHKIPLEIMLDLPDLKLEGFYFDNIRLSEEDRDNFTVNATVSTQYVLARNVQVSLFIDGTTVANATIAEIPEGGRANVLLSYELAGTDKGEHNIQVAVDPNNEIIEKNEHNNDLSEIETIGPLPEEEEFNWRPYIFLTGVIIFLVVFMVYVRWRRKV